MNKYIVWEGEGKLFRRLELLNEDGKFFGHFQNGVYTPNEIVTLTSKTVDEAIIEVQRYDEDYYELASLPLEEG